MSIKILIPAKTKLRGEEIGDKLKKFMTKRIIILDM